VGPVKDYRAKYEIARAEIANYLKKKYNRILPLDEMLSDRWEKSKLLGLGEGTSVYENVYIYGEPKVGRNVWIGPLVVLDATGGLEIGDGCDISCGVMIFTHSTHTRAISEGKAGVIRKSVKIGNFTYVGSGAIILPGTTVGDHCVIGAGAVVTADLPAYSVSFGIPARVVGRVILKNGSVDMEYFEQKTKPRVCMQTLVGKDKDRKRTTSRFRTKTRYAVNSE
jgi:acetyltransferase-like isoleucine patch superfamily enzyme